VLVVSVLLSAALFAFDYQYVPEANRKQDAIRDEIKGRPVQTYLRPERKWIKGDQNRIYYYRHFDTDQLEAYYDALPGKSNAAGLTEVIVSWQDFDAGYSADTLAKLLKNYPTAAGELFAAFRREHLESKAKN